MIIYLKKSTKPEKKFMVLVDGKTIHFGANGMSDYTKHKDHDRMERYNTRHKARENWNKSGIKTAGFWSKWLLWNKPSLSASKKDIEKRFNVKISGIWPKAGFGLSKSPRTPKTNSRYEACVIAVKSKQASSCFGVDGKWIGGKGCYNPWAICSKSVGRTGIPKRSPRKTSRKPRKSPNKTRSKK
jgi:hypothetical protein